MQNPQYYIEVVWNREFHFTLLGSKTFNQLDKAISYLMKFENEGDGARVKESRIINFEGNVVYRDGGILETPEAP